MNKTIHFIWIFLDRDRWTTKRELPVRYVENVTAWRKAYPDFEVRVWNGPSIMKTLSENSKLQPMIKHLNAVAVPVGRVDALRLLLVWRYGGTYTDLDSRPIGQGLRTWVAQPKPVWPLSNNALFYAPMGTEVLLQIVKDQIVLLDRSRIPWYWSDTKWCLAVLGSGIVAERMRQEPVGTIEWMNQNAHADHDFDMGWMPRHELGVWLYCMKPCQGKSPDTFAEDATI